MMINKNGIAKLGIRVWWQERDLRFEWFGINPQQLHVDVVACNFC